MALNVLEKIVSTPSKVVDSTVTTSQKVIKQVEKHDYLKKAKNYWKMLGPGLTTGAADDDPSGIATYSQAGATVGNQLLWLASFTFPLSAIIQEMCARIGIVTGRGLAGNIRVHFPRWVLYITASLLFFANTLNIGADLGAMTKAVQLLFPRLNNGYFFVWIITAFTLISLGIQIYSSYEKYSKFLKWLALILLSYVFTTLIIPNLDWANIFKSTLIPQITFSKQQIILICGILGTTISPYLFFWQTSQEVEDQILEGKTSLKLRQEMTTKPEISNMRVDVWSGIFFSNLVMFFIIAACSATLFTKGITNITTASDAAEALRPLAGDQAYLLFALGIIGTGMLAVPILAGSAAYALAESFRWKQGLYRKLKDANAFYGVIIFSTIIGLSINFIGLDSIKALLYTAVANGLIAPVILALIVIISSKKQVMGEWANKPIAKFFGWAVVILMTISGISALVSLFS
ncbi:divalent metal cation transporter [Candidatus Microgenomates bacterium]|nr:divalent metal cation transporter [Candidatus Microgenomates bacterium]